MKRRYKSVRIGAGAGFAGDRIRPAVDLAESARLDFLVFECLAERTMALAQLRMQRGAPGYDPLLESRLRAVLPACRRNGVRIITNMGGADPRAAQQRTVEIARELGLHGLRVARVQGDDVMSHLSSLRPFDCDESVPAHGIIAANAYLGADALLPALEGGADVVLTGRVADPSLFVAPLMHAFGWDAQDYERMGALTAVGHLLECAGQLTGGYFADPPYKVVPQLEDLGFPFAEVMDDGTATFSKLPQTGGLLNLQTAREQLLYEVMNPARYVTPDAVADFTSVRLTQVGEDTVRLEHARGGERPSELKVSVGMLNGYFGEGQISYAGLGAQSRAELAQRVLASRLGSSGNAARYELVGVNSMHAGNSPAIEPYEVRLRVAGAFATEQEATLLTNEVESLYVNGPSGGAGVVTSVRESVAITSALLARHLVQPTTHIEVA